MPRNQEVIRQWKILHALESSRHGATIDGLAGDLDVTTRTIRRDLAALQEAGFALYDEVPFGFTPEEFQDYAADKGMRRFGTISSARGRPLGEIDVDYSPLHLEDTFADEDRQALASMA